MDIADLAEPPDRPRKNEFQKLHEQMELVLKPFRQMEEMQDLLKRCSPVYQLQELLRQMDPHDHFREMTELAALPRHIQEVIDGTSITVQAQRLMDRHFPKNTLASLGLDNEALRKAAGLNLDNETLRRAAGLDSISDIAKQYERYLTPIWEQQDFLERANRQAFGGFTAKEIAKQLDRANPIFQAMEEAKKALDRLWPSFKDIDFSQFQADEEDEQEASKAARDITNTATGEPTLKEAVDQIVAAIEAQHHPAVKVLLWLYFKKVFDILINGAVGAVMSVYITAAMTPTASPQAETRMVKQVARQVIGSAESLKEYRYVSAKVLIVRQTPRTRSPEVARLSFGKPVRLLKKHKDFALVVWSDNESGAEIQGWVFARYLDKFN